MPLARAGASDAELVGGPEEALRWLMTAQESVGEGLARSARRLRDRLERDADPAGGRRRPHLVGTEAERTPRPRSAGSTVGSSGPMPTSGPGPTGKSPSWPPTSTARPPRLQRLVINNYDASAHFNACMFEALDAYGVR